MSNANTNTPGPCAAEVAVRFLLDVDAEAALLSRLLAPFARRNLIPDRMWSHRNGQIMHVEIALEAMPEGAVSLVEGNLRQVVGVRSLTQVRPQDQRYAA
jgi:hypothetical protein